MLTFRLHAALSEIPACQWDALTGQATLSHAFVGWLSDGRLILTTVSVQQQHVESMLEDRLGARYQRLDTEWPAAAGLGIDVATAEAAEALLRMSERTLARLSSTAWKQALG